MSDVLKLLLSSPWFWIVLVLVILILVFRSQLARLIDRTQKAKAEAGKEGAKIELVASSPATAEKAAPAPSSPPTPPATTPGEVTMKDVLLEGGSQIGDIEGRVKMETVILDDKSKIGKIKGG